jgi:hypothetical protein
MDLDSRFGLPDRRSGLRLFVRDALETGSEELAVFNRIGVAGAGFGPIERGVGARDELGGESFRTVAVATTADSVLRSRFGTAAKRLLLSVGCFGSESRIARADAGR